MSDPAAANDSDNVGTNYDQTAEDQDNVGASTGGRRRRRRGRSSRNQKKSRGNTKKRGKKGGKKHGTKKKGKKGKKGVSGWIAHVKQFAKKHHLKYPEALKDKRCGQEYRK